MKVKVFSWIVGAAYVFCGFMFLLILGRFEAMFSELQTPLPLLTRVLFSPTPAGWLLVLLCGGGGAVLKDFRFVSPWANVIFTVTLLAAVVFLAVGLFLPVMYIRIGPGT